MRKLLVLLALLFASAVPAVAETDAYLSQVNAVLMFSEETIEAAAETASADDVRIAPKEVRQRYSLERPLPNYIYRNGKVLNIMADPQDPERRVDHAAEYMHTLQQWSEQTVLSGSGKLVPGYISPGTVLVFRRDGTGTPWIHACGNDVPSLRDKQPPPGKSEYCPICTHAEPVQEARWEDVDAGPPPIVPTPVVADQCVNLEGIQESIPNGMFLDRNGNCAPEVLVKERNYLPWVLGGLAVLALALSQGGGDDKGECDTCKPRVKPGSTGPVGLSLPTIRW